MNSDFPAPKIGIVIGTYGALPYIHLHLENARRLYPQASLLVHDDASPEAASLRELCARYGADFVSSTQRGGHCLGDIRVYGRGLEWAKRRNIDLLIKFSRRFLPLYDFQPEVQRLLWDFPSPTLSSFCTTHSFGFRTEAMGMVVDAWTAPLKKRPSALEVFADVSQREWRDGLVEAWVHHQARRLHQAMLDGELRSKWLDADIAKKNEAIWPKHRDVNGYSLWPVGGIAKTRATPLALWHETDGASKRFEALAQTLNLPYRSEDFAKYQSSRGT